MRQFRAEREGEKKSGFVLMTMQREPISRRNTSKNRKEFFEFFELRVGECVSLFVMELIKP